MILSPVIYKVKIFCLFGIILNLLYSQELYGAELSAIDAQQTVVEGERTLEALSLLKQADLNIQNAQYERALQSLNLAYQINKTLTDSSIGRSVLNSMANIYYNGGQLEQAHRYYTELVLLDKAGNDEDSLAVSLFNLAHVNASQESFQQANINFEQSLAISQSLGDESGSSYTLKAMGVNAQAQQKLEDARIYLQRALEGFQKIGDDRQVGAVYRHLADVSQLEGYLEEAVIFYQKALPILAKHSFSTALLRTYRGLSNVYEQLADYEKAYVIYQAYSDLLQQQQTLENQQSIQQLQVEFETQRFADENGRLELLSQNQQYELQHRQTLLSMQYLVIALATGMTILLAMMWWRSQQYAKKMKVLATIDELTGLLNRRAIMQFGKKEWQRALRFKRPFSCLIFDIDHFKSINDTWGHAVGDQVLKKISATVTSTLRQTDALGRFGGEEFLLLAAESDQQQTEIFAERIRSEIEAIHHEGVTGRNITVSIGIAQVANESSLNDLIQHADDALYEAKDNGRNRVVVYKEALKSN